VSLPLQQPDHPYGTRIWTPYSSSTAGMTGIALSGLNLTDQGYRADLLEGAETPAQKSKLILMCFCRERPDVL
jgi:hypothetical protein